jgi:hypothetical protein
MTKTYKEFIEGGKGAKANYDDFESDELAVGIEVEMEHTLSRDIASDHLTENPKYYSNLIKKGIVDEPSALRIAKDFGWI